MIVFDLLSDGGFRGMVEEVIMVVINDILLGNLLYFCVINLWLVEVINWFYDFSVIDEV